MQCFKSAFDVKLDDGPGDSLSMFDGHNLQKLEHAVWACRNTVAGRNPAPPVVYETL